GRAADEGYPAPRCRIFGGGSQYQRALRVPFRVVDGPVDHALAVGGRVSVCAGTTQGSGGYVLRQGFRDLNAVCSIEDQCALTCRNAVAGDEMAGIQRWGDHAEG